MPGFRPVKKIDRLAEVIDFCWNQTKKRGYCGYPVVMRDQADQADGLRRIFHDAQDQLLVLQDEELIAVAPLLVDQTSGYLQTLGGIFTDDFRYGLKKLESFRDEFYPGYMLLIGYPVKEEIRQALSETGSLIEQLHFYEFQGSNQRVEGIKKLDRSAFSDMAALHDALNPGMYWSSDKILNDWSHWSIYQHPDSTAYLLVRRTLKLSEIYGLYFPDDFSEVVAQELIRGAAQDVMIQSPRLIASCDPVEGLDEIYLKSGFSFQDDYMVFSV